MFDTIVESVLNEITAQDAYEKFYNTLPADEYNALTSGRKFDNMMKIILNSIKDGECDFAHAEKFFKLYDDPSLDNNIRIQLNQGIKTGEYDSLSELICAIDMLKKTGVVTKKSVQKDGYIKIYEDDNILITCTTTYEANHHYYGNTKWCTASDRLGRYDGWIYFLKYVFNNDYIDIDNYIKLKRDEIKCCLVQIVSKKEERKIQMQVFSSGAVGQICDEEDHNMCLEDILVPDEALNNVFDNSGYFVNLTFNAFENESKYQFAKEDFLKAKRKIVRERRRKKREELERKVDKEYEEKDAYIANKFEELCNSNLFYNVDFVNQINDTVYGYCDSIEEVNENEELAKKNSYCALASRISSKKITVCMITAIIGAYRYVDTDYDGNPVIKNAFSTSEVNKSQNVIIIAENDSSNSNNYFEKIIAVKKGNFSSFIPRVSDCMLEKRDGITYKILENLYVFNDYHGDYCEIFDSMNYRFLQVPNIMACEFFYDNEILIGGIDFDSYFFVVDMKEFKLIDYAEIERYYICDFDTDIFVVFLKNKKCIYLIKDGAIYDTKITFKNISTINEIIVKSVENEYGINIFISEKNNCGYLYNFEKNSIIAKY